MPEFSVASFNVHGGIDGWGRPFDVVDACRRLDADVLVLQETWSPLDEGGGAKEGLAEEVAASLGYRLTAVPVAPARRYPVPPDHGAGWGPLGGRRQALGLRVEVGGRGPGTRSLGRRGVVGIAVLTRLPVAGTDVLDLGRFGRDRVRRVALRVTVGGPDVVVVGTHLPHIRHGSPVHVRRLQGLLPDTETPAVLMGDMNMWGPPLTAMLPGWSRAVRGRSWPAWRPLFQIDHILVTRVVRVMESGVVEIKGSDHLPVRAQLAVP